VFLLQNKDYVFPGGDYDVNQLFSVENVSERVREYQSEIPGALKEMRLALKGAEPPEVRTGNTTHRPYP
jgi:hypothetical protein